MQNRKPEFKIVKPININVKQVGAGNGFFCVYGEVSIDKEGKYQYTEYAKENPRTIAVDDIEPAYLRAAILREIKKP